LGVQQRTQARGLAWQMFRFEERSRTLAKTRQWWWVMVANALFCCWWAGLRFFNTGGWRGCNH